MVKVTAITPTGWLCCWHETFTVRKEQEFTPTHFFNSCLTGSFLKTPQHLLRAAGTVISTASSS